MAGAKGLRDAMGGTGSAGARRCVMKRTGRMQNAVAYPVTEFALVSGREICGEKIQLMIALDECMYSGPNKRYRSPNVVW